MSRIPKTAVKGDDIPAVSLLSAEISRIKGIKDPPTDHSAAEKYRKETEEIINKALNTTNEVNEYALRINAKMDELRAALKQTTVKVQEAIKTALNSIEYAANAKGHSGPQMKYVNEMMQLEVSKKRLEEAVVQTQIVVEKMQNNILVTKNDIDTLKGYINSWETAKRQNYEDGKRKEEERRKNAEIKKKKQGDEEEQRRREEQKRRREEEDRKKRKEEEERLRREEEERKRQEMEELRRRQMEEERRKREEVERLKKEGLERERLLREEEQRRRRLDPNNWKPLVYTRQNDEVDGHRSHHQGINCIVTAVSDSLHEDDIECLASDEDRDIIPALADGERILSSVIEINTKKGPLNCEVPIRTFIPHQPVPDAGDELVVKVSVNGSDWMMMNSVRLPSRRLTDKNVRLVGVELGEFETAKVVVVARPKSQNLIIDKTGTSQYSTYDKNVKLFVPRDAFKKPTEVKFSVKAVPDEVLSALEYGSDCIGPIVSTGPIVSLACQAPPAKVVEIDLLKSSDSVPNSKHIKTKSYQLFKTNKTAWQVADIEFKDKGKDKSFSLPAAKTHYSVMEVEVPKNTSKEDVAKVAAALYDCMNKSVVRMITKQREQNPEHLMVQCLRREDVQDRLVELKKLGYTADEIRRCLRREDVQDRLVELKKLGYTAGPDTSREFYLADGQKLQVSCTGNIEPTAENNKMVTMPFYAYMDTAKQEFVIQVKDTYKQRDLPDYVGNIHCNVLPLICNTSSSSGVTPELDVELPVTLPKTEHIPSVRKAAPVRFPHHLSALTMCLSWKLAGSGHAEPTIDWFSVLSKLSDRRKMQTLRNRAKNKCTDSNDQNLCRIMLEDWMKTTNMSEDKLLPIVKVLNEVGLRSLGKECEDLVEYHKVKMSDAAIQDIGDKVIEKPRTLGERLELSENTVKKCISENPDSEKLQVTALLMEWRHSQQAIEKGTNALEFLASLVLP